MSPLSDNDPNNDSANGPKWDKKKFKSIINQLTKVAILRFQ